MTSTVSKTEINVGVSALIDSLTDIIASKVAARIEPPAPAPTPEPLLPNEYVDTREAARILGLSVKGLEGMRLQGRGPAYVRIGGRIRYRRADLAK